mgnify:CR=1 FL=1
MMLRFLVWVFAAASVLDRGSGGGVPHAVVIVDDGHLPQSCHEVSKLLTAEDNLFVYLATQRGTVGESRRLCPVDMAVVEAAELSEAENTAVWTAAGELAAFPRSSVAMLDTHKFLFNMEAVKALFEVSKKSKKPVVYPVRFAFYKSETLTYLSIFVHLQAQGSFESGIKTSQEGGLSGQEGLIAVNAREIVASEETSWLGVIQTASTHRGFNTVSAAANKGASVKWRDSFKFLMEAEDDVVDAAETRRNRFLAPTQTYASYSGSGEDVHIYSAYTGYDEYLETMAPTVTSSSTQFPSASPSQSPSGTASASSSFTTSAAPTTSASPTGSASLTSSPSMTSSSSALLTPSSSPSSSPTPALTPSQTPSSSATPTATATTSPSGTPSVTPTAFVTPSATIAPSIKCPSISLQHYVEQAVILLPNDFDSHFDTDPREFDFSSAFTAPVESESAPAYASYSESTTQQNESINALPPYAIYKYPGRLQEVSFGFNCARDCTLSDWSRLGECQASLSSPEAPRCGQIGVQVARRSVVVPANRWGSCEDDMALLDVTRCPAAPCAGTSTFVLQTTFDGMSLQDFNEQQYLSTVKATMINASARVGASSEDFDVLLVSAEATSSPGRRMQGVSPIFPDDVHTPATAFVDSNFPVEMVVSSEGASYGREARFLQIRSAGLSVTTAINANVREQAQVTRFQLAAQTAYSGASFQTALIASGAIPVGATIASTQISVSTAFQAPADAIPAPTSETHAIDPSTGAVQSYSSTRTTSSSADQCFLTPSRGFNYLVVVPQVVRVSEGAEVEVSLLPHAQSSKAQDDILTATITSLPNHGVVSQLSEVFAKHGYPPISGTPVLATDAPQAAVHRRSIAFRSPKRHFKSKGAYGVLGFTTGYPGQPHTAAEGEVFFVPPSGLIALHTFVFDLEGWSVHNNGIGSGAGKGRGALQHASHAEGAQLNRFIYARDNDMQRKVQGIGGQLRDRSPWYFQAPGDFVKLSRAAAGGYLTFTVSISPEFSFDDVGPLADSLPLVEFECSVCPGQSRVFRYYLPRNKWPKSHAAVQLTVPLSFAEWVRGPLAWQPAARVAPAHHPRVETRLLHKNENTPACECEFWRALQFMDKLRVFGDVTNTAETVKIDRVQLVASTGDLGINPGCLQSKQTTKDESKTNPYI